MRYLKTSKKMIFICRVKTAFTFLMVFALSIGMLRVFGLPIIRGTLYITSGNALKSNKVYAEGFEEDFSRFVNIHSETTEQIESVKTPVKNNDAVIVNLSAVSGKYKNYSGTSVINNTDYDVGSIMYSDFEYPTQKSDEPYILIYHTHTSEQYYGGGSVVDAGKAMADEFERLGYKTIHHTTVYDKEQFSGAYSRSAKGVKQILEKYPSVRLVFDVHRDSITTTDGEEYKPTTVIDGAECAQVMLVCGTDEKGLEHPNWRQNFKFALAVSRIMNSSYNSLSRPVNLRGDRFNTHFTDHSVLLEMGSSANTLEEAKSAAVYTARSIIKTIEK